MTSTVAVSMQLGMWPGLSDKEFGNCSSRGRNKRYESVPSCTSELLTDGMLSADAFASKNYNCVRSWEKLTRPNKTTNATTANVCAHALVCWDLA